MTYTVIFSAPAEADLFAIYDYIAERAGGAIALRFVESIEAYCLGFAHMPERSLPSGVVGPVLLSALRRLASICLSELIEDQRVKLGSFCRRDGNADRPGPVHCPYLLATNCKLY